MTVVLILAVWVAVAAVGFAAMCVWALLVDLYSQRKETR